MAESVLSFVFKISGLDKEDVKNHRSIFSLPFISNFIDIIVEHTVHHDNQSAYGRCHSRGATLLKVHSTSGEIFDEGYMIAFIMLELIAAFDVIEFSCGIEEKGLNLGKIVPH